MSAMYGAIVCVVLASLCCTIMTATASGLELWSDYRDTTGATEYQIGLWKACTWTVGTNSKVCSSMPDAGGSLCHGIIVTGQAFSIIATLFYFFVFLLSLYLCASRKPVYKGLRWAIVCCSVVALAANIITFSMWVGYAEGPFCGQGNTQGFTWPLRDHYGSSFAIDVFASFLGLFIPCVASYIAIAGPSKPPKQVSYPLEISEDTDYYGMGLATTPYEENYY